MRFFKTPIALPGRSTASTSYKQSTTTRILIAALPGWKGMESGTRHLMSPGCFRQ
jgi:hypothetical protein